MNTILNNDVPPQFIKIRVNNTLFDVEMDSGAFISAISFDFYKKNFAHIPIRKSDIILRSYDNKNIPSEGLIIVTIKRNHSIEGQKLLFEKAINYNVSTCCEC